MKSRSLSVRKKFFINWVSLYCSTEMSKWRNYWTILLLVKKYTWNGHFWINCGICPTEFISVWQQGNKRSQGLSMRIKHGPSSHKSHQPFDLFAHKSCRLFDQLFTMFTVSGAKMWRIRSISHLWTEFICWLYVNETFVLLNLCCLHCIVPRRENNLVGGELKWP